MNATSQNKLIQIVKDVISARLNFEDYTISEDLKLEFSAKSGVFVTLYINSELKGCIGFPRPILPLYEAVINSAIAAAFEDIRFEPITLDELDNLKVEISILTEPKLIEVKDPKEYFELIKIGRDGIIVEEDFEYGLLLPQVAVEQNWNSIEFLENACLKAGLDENEYKNKECKIYIFSAEIIKEK